ncbi:MAG TPA: UvrD-helicase domain-containing protein [Polyangiaceae bacterium]|nr:UvrD-helicase domain-containing protein [Polyangiaceae bacterium]
MRIVADLHIHSRFSRATSRDLDFPALHRSALEKGIQLLGTGDFTHPGWMREIEEQLVPAEQGLFRLRDELARKAEEGLPAICRAGYVRFALQVEVSNIYKRDGKVRKNHNLVFVPGLEPARRLIEKLSAIGNLASDGRPILGLDARHLLEITLETDPESFLVPAHIWTPWFSMLGSMSGFDSLRECFGDLAKEVFAAETGLSSDPPMNWRVGFLDRISLVSSSDAHSPSKLGREATMFDVDPSFASMRRALRTGEGLLGTLEFFPEEGKYHLDGHRKCGVRLDPEQTREVQGRCPVCGGKLTVGVMSRVMDLTDRPEGARASAARPFVSLVSLAETVGEALGCGADSKRVRGVVDALVASLGPELTVLREAPLEDVAKTAGGVISEAVRRVRAGELTVQGGYDGEFGTVCIFGSEERDALAGQERLIAPASVPAKRTRGRAKYAARDPHQAAPETSSVQEPRMLLRPTNDPLAGLDPQQLKAATCASGPLLVVAGPGTGKTRTLVARIAWQILEGGVRPERVLALSFTRQAAEELRSRLIDALPAHGARVVVSTFHGFGLRLLGESRGDAPAICDEEARLSAALEALGPEGSKRDAERLVDRISRAKQRTDTAGAVACDEGLGAPWERYHRILAARGMVDVDDLVLRAWELLGSDPGLAGSVAERFDSVNVDEYQDVNDVQAELVGLWSPGGKTLCAIGDPDQAIYGFRGAQPGHFLRFREAFEGARVVQLERSYRLTAQVLGTARSVLGSEAQGGELTAWRDGPKVELVGCGSSRSEAEQILVRLERVLGGTSLFAVDSGRGAEAEHAGVGFGDVAVLVRTRAQRGEILEALGRSGVPCRQVGEDETHDPRSEKVAVMTMHAAKGREFAVVFVAGAEQGLMPLRVEGFETDDAEERRLLYVALTRAKLLAVVTWCRRRVLFGRALEGEVTPFLRACPRAMVDRTEVRVPRRGRQLSLF